MSIAETPEQREERLALALAASEFVNSSTLDDGEVALPEESAETVIVRNAKQAANRAVWRAEHFEKLAARAEGQLTEEGELLRELKNRFPN